MNKDYSNLIRELCRLASERVSEQFPESGSKIIYSEIRCGIFRITAEIKGVSHFVSGKTMNECCENLVETVRLFELQPYVERMELTE